MLTNYVINANSLYLNMQIVCDFFMLNTKIYKNVLIIIILIIKYIKINIKTPYFIDIQAAKLYNMGDC